MVSTGAIKSRLPITVKNIERRIENDKRIMVYWGSSMAMIRTNGNFGNTQRDGNGTNRFAVFVDMLQ